jgi:hypothetical protein
MRRFVDNQVKITVEFASDHNWQNRHSGDQKNNV